MVDLLARNWWTFVALCGIELIDSHWLWWCSLGLYQILSWNSVPFWSLAILSPRVCHVLSPFICHSDRFLHGESCPCLDVVHPGRVWSSSPACTWHCSLHYLFLPASPSFLHGVSWIEVCGQIQIIATTVLSNTNSRHQAVKYTKCKDINQLSACFFIVGSKMSFKKLAQSIAKIFCLLLQ